MDSEDHQPESDDGAEHPADGPAASDGDPAALPDTPSPAESKAGPAGSGLAWAVAALLAVVSVGLVVALISVLRTSENRFDELADAVAGLDQHVGDVARRVDSLGAQVAAAGTTERAPSITPTAPSSTGIPGGLPLFESTENDPAVLNGVVLGEVTGIDYYTNETLTYSPNGDKARVWMVWAHWCPYCQAELPDVSTWYQDNADAYPNIELVTVTSSIDPARGNPLEPYLDDSDFAFPVLVDGDYRLASQFGTSGFPYWVVTAKDGRVLLRLAGAIGIERVVAIFDQLEALTAEA